MHAQHQPAWLAAALNRPDAATIADGLLTARTKEICERYRSVIHSWDVVNEAIDENTGQLRPSPLASALGGAEAAMDIAFHTARSAAAPETELVYNDFMSWDSSSALHRVGVLRLLEGFRKRGTPVDALGLQSHIVAAPAGKDGTARQPAEWHTFLQAVTDMGYRLLITEFDVDDRQLPYNWSLRDQAVADVAREYLDLTLAFRQLNTLMLWGLTDMYSWYQAASGRWHWIERRPCPFDDSLRPKPLHGAIAAALSQAPLR